MDEQWCNHDTVAVRGGVCECGEVVDPWASDATYTVWDWHQDVACDNTRLGYWDWVKGQREYAEDEARWEAVHGPRV